MFSEVLLIQLAPDDKLDVWDCFIWLYEGIGGWVNMSEDLVQTSLARVRARTSMAQC